jgi:hypothetical protein
MVFCFTGFEESCLFPDQSHSMIDCSIFISMCLMAKSNSGFALGCSSMMTALSLPGYESDPASKACVYCIFDSRSSLKCRGIYAGGRLSGSLICGWTASPQRHSIETLLFGADSNFDQMWFSHISHRRTLHQGKWEVSQSYCSRQVVLNNCQCLLDDLDGLLCKGVKHAS